MSAEKTEMIDSAEDKEPVYFAPKRVSLVSDIASILSWVVLVGFIVDVVMQIMSLQSQIKSAGYVLVDLLKQSAFIAVLFSNLLVPLLTGLGIFVILQAASVGLNMFLEMDYNSREAKDKAKA